MWENIWANIIRNWSTSGIGLITAAAAMFAIFYPDQSGFINQVASGVAVLFGAIFALIAKSASVTGTAANPRAKNAGEADPGPIVPKV
jgi:hypothetical protein